MCQYIHATGLSKQTLTGTMREHLIVTLRHIVAYAMRKDGYKLTAIAKRLNRDHSTILNSIAIVDFELSNRDGEITGIYKLYQNRLLKLKNKARSRSNQDGY